MRKSIVEADRPQMTIKYDACALHTGYIRLQTQTFIICSIYCFSKATVVTRTRVHIMLSVRCLCCFLWNF